MIIVKANIKLRSAADGGLAHGLIIGYRANHVFEYPTDGNIMQTYVGDIKLEGQDRVEPGEEALVVMRFLLNQQIERYLTVGRRWWRHEGSRLIGEALL
jgi:hypothetical protein